MEWHRGLGKQHEKLMAEFEGSSTSLDSSCRSAEVGDIVIQRIA